MKNQPAYRKKPLRVKVKQIAKSDALIKGFQALILVTCALLLSA